MQVINILYTAAIIPAVLAAPTPEYHIQTNDSLVQNTSSLLPRADNQKWPCKFSFSSNFCAGTSPSPTGIAVSLGSNPDRPFRMDSLGLKVGGASPCYRGSDPKSKLNSFWLTDNTCANADKSRYDVIAVFDSIGCRDSGKRTQFDIGSSWIVSNGEGFCRKVDFTVRGVQLWQWLPNTLPGQLNGAGFGSG